MQLFYNPKINTGLQQIIFDKEESRHIIRVLRKKEGDILTITNGEGVLFFASIVIADDKKCTATITKFEKQSKTWNYNLHVAIAPTKNIDRFEWFLEKATEIGIDQITPIICQNSERKIIKLERLEKIILSAMKQSLKYKLPQLNEPVKFSDFINHNFEGHLLIAHCKNEKKTHLKEIENNNKYTILIGPEGDFSSQEIEKALAVNATPITLGKSRLRTETAGIIAVQNISFIHQ